MEIILVEVNGVSSAPLFEAEEPVETGQLLFIYDNLLGEGIDVIVEAGTDGRVELIRWDVSDCYSFPGAAEKDRAAAGTLTLWKRLQKQQVDGKVNRNGWQIDL
ncbi:hypothetical protein ACFLWI_04635 [Chloroflexota bacterium]